MKVVQLPDVLYDYLVHLIETYANRGIHPTEGLAINSLWDAVKTQVTTIDDAVVAQQMQQMAHAGSPDGQTFIGVDGRSYPAPPECERCYSEEGSFACIRHHEVSPPEPAPSKDRIR